MADTFREAAQELAPRGMFLRDRVSQALLSALGGTVADTTALVREGVLQRYARTCDDTALVEVGETRQMERAPAESAADYRHRLSEAWDWHSARGTKAGLVEVFGPLGVSESNVFVWNHYETGVGEWWSNVYIVADMTDGPWTVDVWDDGVWDDGGVWDLNGVTSAEIAYLRRTIRKNKWVGAFPIALWAWIAGDIWDAGDTWDSGVWADSGEVYAILLGHHWDQSELLYGDVPEKWDDGSTWEEAFPE